MVGASVLPKGLNRELIVDAAVQLTSEVGLTGWSLRELAARLGVASTAIYHHVGHREDLLAAVAARLVAEVPRVDPGLDWRDWFEQTLLGIRSTLWRYPGVAHWFMMHGPSIPEAADIVDAGVGCLERAGFGDDSAFAYSLLFNQGVGTVAFSQDRITEGAPDGRRDFDSLSAGLSRVAERSTGAAKLVEFLLTPMINDHDGVEQAFRRSLRVVMRGLAAEYLDEH